MSEDVSAYIKLAVVMVMLGVIIAAIVFILVAALNNYNKWRETTAKTVSESSSLVGTAYLNSTEPITAAAAYRLLNDKRSLITTVQVQMLDGTTVSADFTTSDANTEFDTICDWLLNNSSIRLMVSYDTVYGGGDDMYSLILEEVDR